MTNIASGTVKQYGLTAAYDIRNCTGTATKPLDIMAASPPQRVTMSRFGVVSCSDRTTCSCVLLVGIQAPPLWGSEKWAEGGQRFYNTFTADQGPVAHRQRETAPQHRWRACTLANHGSRRQGTCREEPACPLALARAAASDGVPLVRCAPGDGVPRVPGHGGKRPASHMGSD